MFKTYSFKNLFFVFSFLACTSIYGKGWHGPSEALENSKVSHKPVLIFVYRDDCGACEDISMRFAKEGYYHFILQGFELAKISVDDMNKQFNMVIDKTPSFIFIDSDRNEIAPMVEGSPSDDMEFTDYLLRVQVVSERLRQTDAIK